jgi:hypothetical protein
MSKWAGRSPTGYRRPDGTRIRVTCVPSVSRQGEHGWRLKWNESGSWRSYWVPSEREGRAISAQLRRGATLDEALRIELIPRNSCGTADTAGLVDAPLAAPLSCEAQTVDMPALCVRASVGTVNKEARTVDLIFSTGAAVDRMDPWTGKRYREVLSMDPAHVRLDRLNAGAPLLDAHSAYSIASVIGAVQPGSARLEKGQGLATVRFSKRDAVEPIWNDVVDEIIRSVSTGYKVYKFQEDTPRDGGIPTRTAIDWEPFEVSMVPMPADVGARVRSGDKTHTNPCVIIARVVEDADRQRRFRLAAART